MSEGIRINKYLSEAGFCSRREADRLIGMGKVTVNGNIITEGFRVDYNDEVCVDGQIIRNETDDILLVYNKPKGVVCSTSEKYNIIDYIGYPKRIYPIGRLDKDSEGLILLTNQGDIADAIMRAANFHEKEYIVNVNKPVTKEFLEGMSKGVPILDTVTRPCKVKKIGNRVFSITITQGLNRQIRRMCEYFDYRVTNLKRIRIMDIMLDNIKPGQYIEMSHEDINKLRKKLGGK